MREYGPSWLTEARFHDTIARNPTRQAPHALGKNEIEQPETQGVSAEGLLERVEEQNTVRGAILQLPAVFREIVLLREFEELSYSVIAKVLGCAQGTVMSRLALRFAPFSPAKSTLFPRGHEGTVSVQDKSSKPVRRLIWISSAECNVHLRRSCGATYGPNI